ncbi:MAG: sterol desaturase family protein [Bacteroidales bacterium]|nr:sterol desaturase family protein [Bacteroidales bacterium]
MEFVAWFTHKFIMHGFLWILHKDHHKPNHDKLEKNDLFALIFAIPSVILLIFGSTEGINIEFWIGLGIALYGIAYFLFHDVLIHERLKIFNPNGTRYFQAIIKAHYDHHAGKKNYGFLFMVPWKYFKEEFSK